MLVLWFLVDVVEGFGVPSDSDIIRVGANLLKEFLSRFISDDLILTRKEDTERLLEQLCVFVDIFKSLKHAVENAT